jgi:hypothetical protein
MQVLLNSDQIEAITSSTDRPAAPRKTAASTPSPQASAPARTSENAKLLTTVPVLQANVTLRRDNDGRIFYVFTDAQTGKELREFPASEVRKAGEGVDELLKRAQERAAHSLDTKA